MDNDLAALQDVRDCLVRAKAAGQKLARMSQAEVDRICKAMCQAAARETEKLAKLAVDETGMGIAESKMLKNGVAYALLWKDLKDLKTVGILRKDEQKKVYEIACPMGTVAAIIPTTNPTSTAIFKCVSALKARNPIVVSPHPRAIKCTSESCRVVGEAAVRAGAPDHSVQCLTNVTLQATNELMRHRLTAVILATGGPDLVKAAYSSGKPALGVGSGNPPAIVDKTADIRLAARMIVASQTFDNGTICSSEQSIVAHAMIRDQLLQELKKQRCHIASAEEIKKLEKLVVRGNRQNPDIVGQYPRKIAEMAGFSVPHDTTVLIAEYSGVGWEFPLSIEKLSPILAFYTARDHDEMESLADKLLRFGGDGHSCSIHTKDDDLVMRLADRLPVSRLMINAPTSQGSVGFATYLVPSLTLGCGSYGGNISSNNISARDLINIKRVAYVKPEVTREDFDPQAYLRQVQAEAFGFDAGGSAGASGEVPVRPYLHDKVAAPAPAASAPRSGGGGTPVGAAVQPLTPQDIEAIISKSLRK